MPVQVDLSRYRGPLPAIVTVQDVATLAQAPPPTAANRGVAFLVSTTVDLEPAFQNLGATPGAVGVVNTDAYGVPYVFRETLLGDIVALPDASLMRFEEVRLADPATGLNVVSRGWVAYRTPPQRALDGMVVFDLFDPDKVGDYYARLVGVLLGQLQVTNRDMARWRDPQKIPAELLNLAAVSIGAVFYPEDSERLRRIKVEAAISATRVRGLAASVQLKMRQLGYLGYASECWQAQSMVDWDQPVHGRVPLYQQASVVFTSNANPSTGESISFQVSEAGGVPALYMLAPIVMVFAGSYVGEPQGAAIAGDVQSGFLANNPILPFSVTIRVTDGSVTYVAQDDGAGALVGDFTGTVDYGTGAWTGTFATALVGGDPMSADYLLSLLPVTPVPQVLIGLTVRDTLQNLIATIDTYPALNSYIDVGAYGDTTPQMLVQSKLSFDATDNPVLFVASSAADINVVLPSLPTGAWNPPSRELNWPVVHLARLVNDDQMTLTAVRADGSDLFPFLTVGAVPGNAYRRSRGAVVFYDNYIPVSGDSVILTFGGTRYVLSYGGSWNAIITTGDKYVDSHAAAESLAYVLGIYIPALLTIARAPLGFPTVVGVGEDGPGYIDPTATWLELPHGSMSGEPLAHSTTNLISLHVNLTNGGPVSFPGLPTPGVANGSLGPTPPMDPMRSRIMSELLADALPVNTRVRQWLTDVNLPGFVSGSGELMMVGDSLTVSTV